MKNIFQFLIVSILLVACKKDYFMDSGVHKGKFDGTIIQYLESKPIYFDTLLQVIRLAGFENVLKSEEITFFAPCDSSIHRSLKMLKAAVAPFDETQITSLAQIKPAVWRKFLSRYIYKGKYSMTDYPQLDLDNIAQFDGRMYTSYDAEALNIGVIFDDVNGVKYLGYRHLAISYIASASVRGSVNSWQIGHVLSVNIEPVNGYVHVLNFNSHLFGFAANEFVDKAIAAGLE